MRRGDLYRIQHHSGDPKKARVFAVVSRDTLIRARFSTLICAPVLTHGDGLSTQVAVGRTEGLSQGSWILCDGLVGIDKSRLTDYVGALAPSRIAELNEALRSALDLG